MSSNHNTTISKNNTNEKENVNQKTELQQNQKSENETKTTNQYRLFSWNVDGLEPNDHARWRWLQDFLMTSKCEYDVVFLSETKTKLPLSYWLNLPFPTQSGHSGSLGDWYTGHLSVHPAGGNIHGVMMLWNKKTVPNAKVVPFDMMMCPLRSDSKCKKPNVLCKTLTDSVNVIQVLCTDGRVIRLSVDSNTTVVGTYTPNAGQRTKETDNKPKHLEYRIKFWDRFFALGMRQILESCPQQKQHVLIGMGDFNVAVHDIDVTAPNKMRQYCGFTAEERVSAKSGLWSTFTDVWRHVYPKDLGYTWHGQANKMRLDYFLVANASLPAIKDLKPRLLSHNMSGSDHSPLVFSFSR